MDDLLSVMKIHLQPWLCALLFVTVLSVNILAADDPADVPLRMANGAVIEGTVQEATPDGLVIQGVNSKYTRPWKYLSAGTRYRYELPMLAAQEVARSNALKKAQAAAAASNAATAKAAAAKAAGANAVGVASNAPPAKK
ncbi:MAG: hypothetical protein NT011_05770 [Kiritimatiellaeota bacterium]|nr:hypothetical protein [Kiritimatiellota bacterium]